MNRHGRTPRPLQLVRYARLGLHLLWGALTIACTYRFLNDPCRLWLKQRWSRQLLDILAVRVDARLHGVVPGSLFVANHVSWLDIVAINAVVPSRFVSKAEVAEQLAAILRKRSDTPEQMRDRLPPYLVRAIEYVTGGYIAGMPLVFPETDGVDDAAEEQ